MAVNEQQTRRCRHGSQEATRQRHSKVPLPMARPHTEPASRPDRQTDIIDKTSFAEPELESKLVVGDRADIKIDEATPMEKSESNSLPRGSTASSHKSLDKARFSFSGKSLDKRSTGDLKASGKLSLSAPASPLNRSLNDIQKRSSGMAAKQTSLISNSSDKKKREVLVGTPVKEGHANYILMYDMLTGIRLSVGRILYIILVRLFIFYISMDV